MLIQARWFTQKEQEFFKIKLQACTSLGLCQNKYLGHKPMVEKMIISLFNQAKSAKFAFFWSFKKRIPIRYLLAKFLNKTILMVLFWKKKMILSNNNQVTPFYYAKYSIVTQKSERIGKTKVKFKSVLDQRTAIKHVGTQIKGYCQRKQ